MKTIYFLFSALSFGWFFLPQVDGEDVLFATDGFRLPAYAKGIVAGKNITD